MRSRRPSHGPRATNEIVQDLRDELGWLFVVIAARRLGPWHLRTLDAGERTLRREDVSASVALIVRAGEQDPCGLVRKGDDDLIDTAQVLEAELG